MAKVLVLYYSSWGHMEAMAQAAAKGAAAAGADVTIKRVPELVPEEVAKGAHYKLDQEAAIAEPLELANYDAIIFGVSTRYGMMASQLKNFLDQTGPLWAEGKLINKVGSVMASTATQHGGSEMAIITTQAALQHHPDKARHHEATSAGKFHQVTAAYEALCKILGVELR